MDDTKIISLLWQRSEDALRALAVRFGAGLHKLATNILGNHHDAEEAVNDTYLAIWNAIPPAKPSPLAPYTYRTGRNVALKRLRNDTAQKRDSRYDLSLDELAEVIGQQTLEEYWDARELGLAIDRYLDTLTRENRVLFLRRYWFGDSIKELSKVSGLNVNTLSVRLHRLRQGLETYLQEM